MNEIINRMKADCAQIAPDGYRAELEKMVHIAEADSTTACVKGRSIVEIFLIELRRNALGAQSRPHSSLYEEIDVLKKQGCLPVELASSCHTIRVRGNRVHPDARDVRLLFEREPNPEEENGALKVELTSEHVEVVFVLLREILDWFHCTSRHAPQPALASFYRQVAYSPQTQAPVVPPVPIPAPLPPLNELFLDRESQRQQLYDVMRRHKVGAKNFVTTIVAPPGYGKSALAAKLLSEVAESKSIRVPDVSAVMFFRCNKEGRDKGFSLGHLLGQAGVAVGKAAKFQQIASDSDSQIVEKVDALIQEFHQMEAVWIVVDNFEALLNEQGKLEDAELQEMFNVLATRGDSLRFLLISRSEPNLGVVNSALTIDLVDGLPIDDAIVYLRTEGAEFDWDKEEEGVLRQLAERVYCVPRALESLVGYWQQKSQLELIDPSDLLKDEQIFQEFDNHDAQAGLKQLLNEQFDLLSTEEFQALGVISLFRDAVSLKALQETAPFLEWKTLVMRLKRDRLISLQKQDGEIIFDLHPLIRELVYARIPWIVRKTIDDKEVTDKGKDVFARSNLHGSAALYFGNLAQTNDNWEAIEDLQPKLEEFYHWVSARKFGAAESIMNQIDGKNLHAWGYYRLSIQLREQLVGNLKNRNSDRANFHGLGRAYRDSGELSRSLSCYEQALTISRENSQKSWRNLRADLGGLGSVYHAMGDEVQARRCFEEALKLAQRKSGPHNTPFLATALADMGRTLLDTGDLNKALSYLQRSLSISQDLARVGDRTMLNAERNGWGNVGRVYHILRDIPQAIHHFERSLEISRSINHVRGQALNLGNLGRSYLVIGQMERASELIEAALELCRTTGHRRSEAANLAQLARIHMAQGKSQSAMMLLREAIQINQRVGDRRNEAVSWGILGEVCCLTQQFEEARSHCLEALDLYGSAAYNNRAMTLLTLGRVEHLEGRIDQAHDAYSQVEDDRMPATLHMALALRGLILLREGDTLGGGRLLTRSLRECDALLHKTPDLYVTLYGRALALLVRGNEREALDAYPTALQCCALPGAVNAAQLDVELVNQSGINADGVRQVMKLLAAADQSSSESQTPTH